MEPPPDPGDHAEDFSHRYAEDMDIAVGQRLLDLGIDPRKIGASDPEHGIRHAAFHPHGRNGGDVTPDGRIVIDSGVMNPELLNEYGEGAARAWNAPLKARIDAMTDHEKAEYETGSHEGALKAAPKTTLPISHAARETLRQMEAGYRGR